MRQGLRFVKRAMQSVPMAHGRTLSGILLITADWERNCWKITDTTLGNVPSAGRVAWLSIWIAALSLAVTSSYAADPGEQARLEQEVAEAATSFVAFCYSADVWRYDNLRPTILRAVAPLGSISRPPEVPVVHLSPGSPDYRRIVGQMMYLYYVCISRKQRLADFLADQEAGIQAGGGLVPPKRDAADKYVQEEIYRVEKELDQARAGYGMACAWAWPYINLRPMCHQPGFEAATILNPFLPVPKIRLSEASPDYKETVAALNYWEPNIPNANARLKDLRDDQIAAEAVVAGQKGKQIDDEGPPEDPRLAQMFEIYQQMKPALRQWRTNQHEVEKLVGPWYLTKGILGALQAQAQAIQGLIYLAEHDKDGNWTRTDTELRSQLVAVQGQIARAQYELGKIESQIKELRTEQAGLVAQINASMGAWIRLCDILGRLGPVAHHKSLPLFDQWIAEEPRLWQLYLSRSAARLHVGQYNQALDDLKRVEYKLRLYDLRPRALAFITSVEAYALYKQNETGEAEKVFADAKRLDKTSLDPHLFRGWSNLERGKYSTAKTDFQMALSLSKKTPRAESHEAMAFLLATCPVDQVRDGDKAVEYATRACELTKEQDWICLDTLGAAHAEAGDFDSAVESATKALKLAPADRQESIRDRIEFYRDKVPYRLK